MSYLQLANGLPDLKKAIISFWVKVGKITPKADKFDPAWTPVDLQSTLTKKQIGVAGGSYNRMGLWPPPRIEIYPAMTGATYKDNFTPFITFGNPGQMYNRAIWEIKQIEDDYYYFGPGGGHMAIMAQVPKGASGAPSPGGGTQTQAQGGGAPTPDVVPPSMIGVYNGTVRIILQTADKPQEIKGYCFAQTRAKHVKVLTPTGGPPFTTYYLPGNVYQWADFAEGEGWLLPGLKNPNFRGEAFWYEDVSLLECTQHPEAFVMDTGVSVDDGKWHHILVSFDITGTVASEATGGQNPTLCRGGDNEAPYGQYSGRNGENALETGEFGEPYEACGKHGIADNGTISSSCKAWVAIDGNNLTRKQLNHSEAWGRLEGVTQPNPNPAGGEPIPVGKNLLASLDENAILPPNAFLAPFTEIRQTSNMITSLNLWERWYRTELGRFTGPAARIEATGEPRRLDYDRPKYSFTPTVLPTSGFPIGIPAGEKMLDWNQNVMMAELQIWADQSHDTSGGVEMFIRTDKKGIRRPASIGQAEKALGKPEIRLHGSGNWKEGKNTGTIEQKFTPSGEINRYLPNPKLEK